MGKITVSKRNRYFVLVAILLTGTISLIASILLGSVWMSVSEEEE